MGLYGANMDQGMKIRRSVINKYKTNLGQLLGSSRAANVVNARKEIAARLRGELNMKIEDIGRMINRDHSTVMYYIKQAWGGALSGTNVKSERND